MLRYIILLAMVLIPIGAQAQTPVQSFSAVDVHRALQVAGREGLVEIQPAFGGSDASGFEFQSRGTAGIFPVLNFTSQATDLNTRSLSGWISIGPAVLHQPPFRLMLVYADDQEIISEMTIKDAGDFVPIRLALPAHPRIERFVFQIQMPVIHDGGTVVFSDLQLMDDMGLLPSAPPSSPVHVADPAAATDWYSLIVRSFAGNDFDPHSDSALDELGMDPVTVLTGNQAREVNVLAPSTQPSRTIPILSVDDPGVISGDYAIAGEISYGSAHAGFTMSNEQLSVANDLSDGDIEGTGYLEMWSDFADGSSYFTRTLAESGPMRKLRGRSGPRQFLLPFHAGAQLPARIRMNLIMPGRGTVSISHLRLMQSAPVVAASSSLPSLPFWFNPRYFWIGVMVLPIYVLVIALEPLVRRGKARSIVMIWIWVSFSLAQLALAWGMAAIGHGVPLKEVGPMLLINLLVLVTALFASRRMPRRYQNVELKRMQLMDSM